MQGRGARQGSTFESSIRAGGGQAAKASWQFSSVVDRKQAPSPACLHAQVGVGNDLQVVWLFVQLGQRLKGQVHPMLGAVQLKLAHAPARAHQEGSPGALLVS